MTLSCRSWASFVFLTAVLALYNMMLGLGLAFPVEIIAMHMLLSQWNVAVAIVVTLLSVYVAVWLAGDARARVLRPVVLRRDEMRIACGIQMKGSIPLSCIASVSRHEPADIDKADKLNYGTFYQANVWVVMHDPVEVRTLLGGGEETYRNQTEPG